MRRQEWVLVALAIVFVGIAATSCIYAAQLQTRINADNSAGGTPWNFILLQFWQMMAPPFVLVGLGCALGLLFSRAARWMPRIADGPEEQD